MHLLRWAHKHCQKPILINRATSTGVRLQVKAMSEPIGDQAGLCNLAVIGDVHNHWDQEADAAALRLLTQEYRIDTACFVGDFANEDPGIIQQILNTCSRLPEPANQPAVLLGNHDAWSTCKRVKGKWKSKNQDISEQLAQQPSGDGIPDVQALQELLPDEPDNGVVQQLKLLGDCHVGYRARQIPGKKVSIVGARPFSQGGSSWRGAGLVTVLYPGVHSNTASAARIINAAETAAAAGHAIVLMSHNASKGLGDQAHDISGIDWQPGAGDHGDPDLRLALDYLINKGVSVPLILCGHMHHRLQGGKPRRMVHIDPGYGTITLNAAFVPRVKPMGNDGAATLRHFMHVQLDNDGRVNLARNVWVQVQRTSEAGYKAIIHDVQELLRREDGRQGSTYHYLDLHFKCWTDCYVPMHNCAEVITSTL